MPVNIHLLSDERLIDELLEWFEDSTHYAVVLAQYPQARELYHEILKRMKEGR